MNAPPKKAKQTSRLSTWWSRRTFSQKLVLSYLLVITYGTLIFLQPLCWKEERASLVDCFFTATSAVCVTGLSPFDHSNMLSDFGKIVLLLLIEIGGLGTMALATLLLSFAPQRASLGLLANVGDTFHQGLGGHVRWLGWKVGSFAFIVQGIGTLWLYFHWIRLPNPPPDTFFNALFHACSAFCNAGFALFSDNMISFRNDYWTNIILILLVIAGGLGYFVHFELGKRFLRFFKRQKYYFSLQSKVMLIGTLLLLAGGGILFFVLEQQRTLQEVSWVDSFTVSLFQTTMTRTAGFNTIDWSQAREISCFIAILWMFIGAGSGSTGGGIKITTAAILFAVISSRLRGRNDVVLFRRVIPQSSVLKAVYVSLISFFAVGLLTGGILLCESLLNPQTHPSLLAIGFETVSACATVGLSMGITTTLTWASKILLCLGMILGRIGPLSLTMVWSEGNQETGFSYPEEDLMVG